MRVGRLIPPGRYARKMARSLRALLRRLSGTPIDVTVLDRQRMRLHLSGNSCEMRILVLPHLFDRYELRLLSRVMHPGSVFIDVGANVGIYTVFAALRGGPTSRVFAVEPNPAALECLRCNLSLNGLTNVVVEPIALGEKAGLVSFKLDRRNIGNSSLVFDRDAPAGDLIEVQGQTLMDLCARYGIVRLDAIQLDVEGAEDQILFPFFAEAPASLWPTLLLVENSEGQWRRDCASMLIEKGYRRKRIPSRNLAFWRPAPRP
jgi:FkbM family methyltransferase